MDQRRELFAITQAARRKAEQFVEPIREEHLLTAPAPVPDAIVGAAGRELEAFCVNATFGSHVVVCGSGGSPGAGHATSMQQQQQRYQRGEGGHREDCEPQLLREQRLIPTFSSLHRARQRLGACDRNGQCLSLARQGRHL